MSGSFRNRPPAVRATMVERTRLDELIRGRFDRRVTTVIAGPGFGKTTLLAQALADPHLDETSVDVWLELEAADNDADNLAAALRSVVRSVAQVDVDARATDVAQMLWAMAPKHVALVLDDCHHLRPGSTGTALLARLLDELPRNAHLVLSGRQRPAIALSRLLLTGQLAEIDEEDLAFTDAEVRVVVGRGRPDDTTGPVEAQLRWPALAELAAVAGPAAMSAYAWEEVMAGLDEERRRVLALCAPLGAIDDELIVACTGVDTTAVELVEGIPLTVVSDDGAVRLHALWEPVLAPVVGLDERAKALRTAAEVLMGRKDHRRAGELYAKAQDHEGVTAVALAVARHPTTWTDVLDVRHLREVIGDGVSLGGARLLLQGLEALAVDESGAVAVFERAAEVARADDDPDLEALAIWRTMQTVGLVDGLPSRPDLRDRAEVLAASGCPFAHALVARHDAYVAMSEGRSADALALVPALAGFEEAGAGLIAARLLLDLGCPEEVGTAAAIADFGTPDGVLGNLMYANALWLRGDIEAESAFSLADALADQAVERSLATQSINVLGLVVMVALAAGEPRRAAEIAARSRDLATTTVGPRSRVYADLAEAVVALDRGDELNAREEFQRACSIVPIDGHPPRQYLHVLGPTYVLVPDVRTALDTASLGPSLRSVIETARALVLLRNGEPVDLSALPWGQPVLLRAHFPPALLTPLALAASAQGVAGADALLATLPDSITQIRRCADTDNEVVSGAAVAYLSKRPAAPSRKLQLRLMGPMELFGDGQPVRDAAWSRGRVRHLLAELVERRECRRRDIMTALWPDLDDRKAGQNLRVNLVHLNSVLQPDRSSAEPPWFVEVVGDSLRLRDEGMTVDAWVLDAALDAGRAADQRGAASEALDQYERAIGLYRGEYLSDFVDIDLGLFERIRLRSASALGGARAAELLLARGEPEGAIAMAERSLRIEPLLERGHLARVRAVLATGDRAAARATAMLCVDAMRDAGLSMDPGTARLLAGLGVGPGVDEPT